MRVVFKVENRPCKFWHARPLGSRIIRYVRDERTYGQTDGRTDKSNAYCLLPNGRGHSNDENSSTLRILVFYGILIVFAVQTSYIVVHKNVQLDISS